MNSGTNCDRIPEIKKQIKEYEIIIRYIDDLNNYYIIKLSELKLEKENLNTYSDKSIHMIKDCLIEIEMNELDRLRNIYEERLNIEKGY